MLRVPVQPDLLNWALQRSGYTVDSFAETHPDTKIVEWVAGTIQPTLKQLEKFASRTRAPIGYFFLPEPPEEPVPIPDFRTVDSVELRRPSPDLLETIYTCEQRQEWFRQYALMSGEEPNPFIGSATTRSDVIVTATQIRDFLDFNTRDFLRAPDMDGALRMIAEKADEAGILVMVNGVVGNNTHRPLDPAEFRGFALADPYAPLIFVNGRDTKAGQMFTLAHEISHLWIGESGISDATSASVPASEIERWCNAVAAETLVPIAEFTEAMDWEADLWREVRRLARRFRVSTLVILRRMKDVGRLSQSEHAAAYEEEVAKLRALMNARKKSGGDFYRTANKRLSSRFARAVLASTWEGRSTFSEAFRLLDCRNVKTLEGLGERYGMAEYLRGGAV